MDNYKKASFGIWGFGRVGAATARYFLHKGIVPGVLDAQPLSEKDVSWCLEQGIRIWQPHELPAFLAAYDYIVPSPGIDLRPYPQYIHKWVAEFDLFCENFKKPIVAITGSVGKTSTTHLLSQCMQAAGMNVATGGNIGIGMLDLLEQKAASHALLELSSFQLDSTRTGAPYLAIITNIYPNHLDRHGTLAAYASAKANLYAHQQAADIVLMPYELATGTLALPQPKGQWYLFSKDRPISLQLPPSCHGIFFIDHQTIVYARNGIETPLLDLTTLPVITFPLNWLIIVSTAYLLNIDLKLLVSAAPTFTVPPHRLEYVAVTNGVTFYNDSKATTANSTLAAVQALANKPLHLFLGGLDKGVDREPAIAQLGNSIRHIYCFGAQAQAIHALCVKHNIASSLYATLEEAFHACTQQIKPGDVVLLSPGGASYDLFKDYEARGARFKQLVAQLQI